MTYLLPDFSAPDLRVADEFMVWDLGAYEVLKEEETLVEVEIPPEETIDV